MRYILEILKIAGSNNWKNKDWKKVLSSNNLHFILLKMFVLGNEYNFFKILDKDKIIFNNERPFYDIVINKTLSEDFMRGIKDKTAWELISSHQELSEEFIREMKDYVGWKYISYNQVLSEKFIEEFKDKVHWGNIVYKQNLSEEFMMDYYEYINFGDLPGNRKLSAKFQEFIREYEYENRANI